MVRTKEKTNPVEAEILEITGAKGKKASEDRGDYLERLVQAIYELEDDEWHELGKEAQHWYNEAAKAVNDNVDVEGFDDEGEPEEEKKPARRGRGKGTKEKEEKEEKKPARRGRAAKPKEEKEEEVSDVDDLEVGQEVLLVTEEDEIEGTITKILRSKIVLEDEDGEKVTVNKDEVEEVELLGNDTKQDKGSGDDAKEIDFEDLGDGLEVRIAYDGEEIEGVVTKLTSRSVTIKPSGRGKAERIQKADIDVIEELGGEEEEEKKPTSRGRGSRTSSASEKPKGRGARGGRGTAKSEKKEKTPSGRRVIFEIMAKDPTTSMKDALELADEELDGAIKESTAKMAYGAFMEAYEVLEKEGRISE